MKKRVVCALLASALIVAAAGCSNNEKKDDNKSTTTTTAAADKGGDSTTAAQGGGDTTDAPADTTAAEEKKVPENEVSGNADAADAVVVWMWNTDVKGIIDGVLKDVDPELYNRIVYVNTGGTDFYQDKLDNIFNDPSNKLYPDIVALEADYILKYTNGSNLLNIADLGITDADYSKEYKYTIDTATNYKGELKALSWQACPGSWTIRASLAEKYLGTSDPAKVQEFFKDWDAVYETAKLVKEKSNGETLLLTGYEDIKRVWMGARQNGWHDADDNLIIDQAMLDYMDYAKKLEDEKLTYSATQWGDDWNAKKTGDYTLALPGCTWYTYWCLVEENFGDYILVDGPQPYSWGGTWLAATKGCADKDAAAKFIKYLTCDADFMAKINAMNSDYVNNTDAIETRKNEVALNNGKAILSDKQGSTLIQYYMDKVGGINGKLITAEDSAITGLFDTQVKEYVAGNKSKDDAIAAFKKNVADTYNYINVG